MGMRFIECPEYAENGENFNVHARYTHDNFLPSVKVTARLKINSNGDMDVVAEKSVSNLAPGESIDLNSTIAKRNEPRDVVFEVDYKFDPPVTMEQTVYSPEENPCDLSDFEASGWAKDRYPEGDTIVTYGSGKKANSPTLDRFMSETGDEYELIVHYYSPIAAGRTAHDSVDDKPSARTYKEQTSDWSKGVMKSRVWCDKNNRYYWVTYEAELNNLSGGKYSPEDIFGGIDPIHVGLGLSAVALGYGTYRVFLTNK